MKYLLEKGANVNVVEKEDWNPLYYAANNGHLEIAKVLLAHGADKSQKDNFKGRTALDVAKYRQFHEIVKLLGGKEVAHRNQEAMEKRGNKKVLRGVHHNHKNLFLGRYLLEPSDVKSIEQFRFERGKS